MLFLCEEGGWARAPGELLEAVDVLFAEGGALEVVEVVSVLSLEVEMLARAFIISGDVGEEAYLVLPE